MFSLRQIFQSSTPNLDILDIGAMIEGTPRFATIYDPDHTNLTLVEPNKKEANNPKRFLVKIFEYLRIILEMVSPVNFIPHNTLDVFRFTNPIQR